MRIVLIYCDIDNLFLQYNVGAFTHYESNPPMGLGSLAATLTAYDFEVKIIDQALLKLSTSEIAIKVLEYNPNILGISCTSLNVENSIKIAKKVKKSEQKCFVIVGGIHPTLKPAETLMYDAFDAVIAGEGEIALLEAAKQISQKGKIENEISGLWMKGSIPQKQTVLLENINVPFPDRNILNNVLYANKGAFIYDSKCYSLFQSRGCPHSCRFCSKPFYHKNYRVRSINNIINEINHLNNEFEISSFSFREDNFTADINHLKNLCYEFIENFEGRIKWECESRATLPFNLLKLMKAAGCVGIWCGVETIVPRWQRWINKVIPEKAVREFYEGCSRLGISTGAYFLLGYPDQTGEELDSDIKFALELPVTWRYFQIISIFPGSQLANFYKSSGLYYKVNNNVGLALTNDCSISDMISLEQEINNQIRLIPRTSIKDCHIL